MLTSPRFSSKSFRFP